MRVYLASPRNQMQADCLNEMPVLLSFSCWSEWITSYVQTFDHLLLDSGAFSEMTNPDFKVDLNAYAEWVERFPRRVAFAGLDDISGNWRRSLKNYEVGGFPTFHDTDPDELLPDLIDISRERGNWLGIGLKPPRYKKERWLTETLDRIPDDIHVHGFALRLYTNLERLNSVDSTNWFRDSFLISREMPWITPAEATRLVVLRYKREKRLMQKVDNSETNQGELW
jgi:hypothetical protein